LFLLLVCIIVLQIHIANELSRVDPAVTAEGFHAILGFDRHSASTSIPDILQLKLSNPILKHGSIPKVAGQRGGAVLMNALLERDVELGALSNDQGGRLQRDTSVVQFEMEWCAAQQPAQGHDNCTSYPTGNTQTARKERIAVYNLNQQGEEASSAPSATDFGVTLVTVTTLDRINRVSKTCQGWAGEIVVLYYLPEPQSEWPNIEEVRQLLPGCVSHFGQVTAVVMQTTREIDPGKNPEWNPEHAFPINRCRNLAISQVETTHYLLTDVDLLPSENLYQQILVFGPELLAQPMTAVVVPAFQYQEKCRLNCNDLLETVPRSLDTFLECKVRGECGDFDFTHGGLGHISTNTGKWLQQGHKLREIPCLLGPKPGKYEPYLIVRKGVHTPRFNEDFKGYGKNKIQFVRHVLFAGFKFVVLPDEFVIHAPHAPSPSNKKWMLNNPVTVQSRAIYKGMEKKLYEFYTERLGRVSLSKCSGSVGHLVAMAGPVPKS
jgi:glycosyltransferase-like protein LARGE